MSDTPRQVLKLKPKVKKRWTAALRSGKYKQTTGVLRRGADNDQAYCCLGVLCDLYDPSAWELDPSGDYIMHWCETALPSTVIEWAFEVPEEGGTPVDADCVVLPEDSQYHDLIVMNDEAEADFKTIADEIDKYL